MSGRKDLAASSENVGYEAKLWQLADALHGGMDAADYKHVVHTEFNGEKKRGA